MMQPTLVKGKRALRAEASVKEMVRVIQFPSKSLRTGEIGE